MFFIQLVVRYPLETSFVYEVSFNSNLYLTFLEDENV